MLFDNVHKNDASTYVAIVTFECHIEKISSSHTDFISRGDLVAILVIQVKSTPDVSGILRCPRLIQFSMHEITVIDIGPTAICEYWGKLNHNMCLQSAS